MFQYFFPNVTGKPSMSLLREAGLSHLFDSQGEIAFREVTNRGPNGGAGVVVGRGELGYYPDRQTWSPWTKFWVGTGRELPSAADFARETQISGKHVVINGNSWLIPKARHFELIEGRLQGVCNLPTKFRYDQDLETWIPDSVKSSYEELWALSIGYMDAMLLAAEGNESKVEFNSFDRLFELALQTNYRIGVPEIDVLELYDSESARAVLDTVIDIDGFATLSEEALKKKEGPQRGLVGGSSRNGQGNSTQGLEPDGTTQQ